ncbi:DUF4007 family protein [Geminocystis sp. CENA526]|uniref:DUF4007 family protein n=1 Tax=Geminocystis sp. CENA526 TaxID=1355871 RepID=UPI003D6FB73F
MIKLQLSFHDTFPFKKDEITTIIKTASEDKGLDDNLSNLMDRTGFGNSKVESLIKWVTRAGLVKEKKLTSEGEIINKLDCHLKSLNSEWLMHFYLSFGTYGLNKPPKNIAEWGGWTYFVYDFIPNYISFKKKDLEEISKKNFVEASDKSIKKDFSILLRAYTENYGLKAIQFIKETEDKETKITTYKTGESIPPNIYLIGYFLAKLWERDFEKETSVLTDEILYHKMGLTQVLGITSDTLQDYLNQLESLGIIEQRRTVVPYQTIARWDDPLILLEKAYVNQ